MTSTAVTRPVSESASVAGRLVSVDIARFLAIAGMMAVHLLVPVALLPQSAGWQHAVAEVSDRLFGGNAAVLFAVLGGVSMVLAARSRLARGDRSGAVLATVIRGLMIAVIGMIVGFAPSAIIVVLVPYGVAMICAAFFVAAPAWLLALVAAVIAVASGPVNASVRAALGVVQDVGSVTFLDFARPAELGRGLLLTGEYPAVTWLAYMLIGMLVGRMLLNGPSRRRLAVVAAISVAVFVTVRLVAALIVAPAASASGISSEIVHLKGMGAPASDSWALALLASPHSGSLGDMLASAAIAVAVLAVLTMVFPRGVTLRGPLAVIRAAGAAPLTVYVVHVVLAGVATGAFMATMTGQELMSYPWYVAGFWILVVHLAVALGIGAVLAPRGTRGPLEALVSRSTRALTSRLRPSRGRRVALST